MGYDNTICQSLINWPLSRGFLAVGKHFSGRCHCEEVAVVGRWPLLEVRLYIIGRLVLNDSRIIKIPESLKITKVTYGLARRSETDGSPVLLHASSLKIDSKTDPVD